MLSSAKEKRSPEDNAARELVFAPQTYVQQHVTKSQLWSLWSYVYDGHGVCVESAVAQRLGTLKTTNNETLFLFLGLYSTLKYGKRRGRRESCRKNIQAPPAGVPTKIGTWIPCIFKRDEGCAEHRQIFL